MPFFRKIEDEKGWGGIWKITETVESLCRMLPNGETYRAHAYRRFMAERRRLEYVSVRALVYLLLGEEKQICYSPTGHPYFSDGCLQLSISHTPGYASVLFSKDYEVGVDSEAVSERILRLKERLIGPEERAESVYDILLHWSSKEAAFKILDQEGIDFRRNLTVSGLACAASRDHAEADGDFRLAYHLSGGETGVFPIHYETTSDFVLTYTFRKLA